MLFGSDNTYPGGVLYGKYGDQPPFASNGDLAFATYMIPVPEPSALALFMLVVAAFIARRRHQTMSRGVGA